MFVRKRLRFAGFQFLDVVFFRRSCSALRLPFLQLVGAEREYMSCSVCCLSRHCCCPTARARLSELVVRRRQLLRALRGAPRAARLFGCCPTMGRTVASAAEGAAPGRIGGAASAAHALPLRRAHVPRDERQGERR